MFNIIKSKKGFTLIEILIVTLIIGVVTFALITTFSKQREVAQYNQEIGEVSSLVKLARNYASTNHSSYNEVDNIVPQEGYGIYFERSDTPGQSKMILFANTSTADEPKRLQYDNLDIIVEEFILAQEAIMETVTLTETGPPPVDTVVDQAVILFEITTAEVTLYNNDNPDNIVAIPTQYDELAVDLVRLGDDAGNSRKTFTIDEVSDLPEMSL